MKLTKLLIILSLFVILIPKSHSFGTNLSSNIELYSTSAIAIDSNSDLIFYEKNKDKKMYPASTTKILTAIIIIENCNLDEIIKIKDNYLALLPEGYQTANLVAEEEISIRDLLTMFLVYSANDCGYVLANYYAGSIETFSEIMNKTAEKIGCKNSHFVNPSGIQDVNHFTTAYDLCLIAKYCMKNDFFRSLVLMPKCTIPETNKSETRIYSNTNILLNNNSKYYIEDCIGIKTGYTKDAGNCLISCFSKNNIEVVCVFLGAPNIDNSYNSRFIDAKNLYEYIYKNFSYRNLVNKNQVIQTIEIPNASKKTKNLTLICEKNLDALLKTDFDIPDPIVKLNKNLFAPIKANTFLGTLTYEINGQTYSCNLLSGNDIEIDYSIYYFLIIIFLVIFLMILIFLIFKFTNRKKYYTDI